jgi:hypothetical protein
VGVEVRRYQPLLDIHLTAPSRMTMAEQDGTCNSGGLYKSEVVLL